MVDVTERFVWMFHKRYYVWQKLFIKKSYDGDYSAINHFPMITPMVHGK